MNKTPFPKKNDNRPQWFIIDAERQNLGRLSTKIARVLLGKNNTMYTPGYDLQERVIVINGKMVNVTGRKKNYKFYYKHSGRPGGLTVKTFEEVKRICPSRIIEQSVKRMLPKNSYGRKLFTKLKIYTDSNHPHKGQSPKNLYSETQFNNVTYEK